MKIYFASDAHLGTRFHKGPLAIGRKLVRWLDSIKEDASTIWSPGDLFGYWCKYKYVIPKGHVCFLGRLAELADRGIEVHVFIGSHDIWMFDYLPEGIGAVIHRDTLTVDLLGKRFFLGHDDEIDFRSKAFRLIRAVFRDKFYRWLHAEVHPRWTFGFTLGWSLNSRKNGLEEQETKGYRGEDAGYMVVFAKGYLRAHPDINFFVFGHRRIMLDSMLSHTSRILITGDWIQFFSYTIWDGENLYMDQSLEETDGQSYPNT